MTNFESLSIDFDNIFSRLYLLERRKTWKNPVKINVTTPDIWEIQKANIEELYSILTGVSIDINFKKKKYPIKSSFKVKSQENADANANLYQLFSAGIDSGSILIHLMNNNENINPVFIDTKGAISSIINYFQKGFNDIQLSSIRYIPKANFTSNGYVPQLRTPLFISAVTQLIKNGECRLIIAENGITAINPAYAPDQKPTWSTHPYILKLMSDIIKGSFDINFSIILPYINKTKSEVIATLISSDRERLLKYSNSCFTSNRRYENRTSNGCGKCYSCVIRNISAGLFELDYYGKYKHHYLYNIKRVNDNSIPDMKSLIHFWLKIYKDKFPKYVNFTYPIRKFQNLLLEIDVKDMLLRDSKQMISSCYNIYERNPNSYFIRLFIKILKYYNLSLGEIEDLKEKTIESVNNVKFDSNIDDWVII